MNKSWHLLETKEVIEELKSSPSGLSQEEAERRLKERGPNELERKKKRSPLMAFLAQFLSPLIYVLFAAAIISLVVQNYIQAAVIFGILLLNAIIGYFQESSAEKSMEALLRLAAPGAKVKREEEVITIPAREIVPGDIILLAQGDKVPADARIIEESNLKADESAFTGESVATEKQAHKLDHDVPVAEMSNMVLWEQRLLTAGLRPSQ